ncbi:MAG: hypothetical protein JW715_00725 [Sedimentisphaerales bacterium]|nr:hypothetical protein [Sedimentisphaerales bacterium]
MKSFNITLALPGIEHDNIHAMSLKETALVLGYGLNDLGHHVVFSGGLRKDCLNIILRYQSFGGKRLPEGYNCIIYQLEELAEEDGWASTMRVLETLRSARVVWDFSEQNIAFLKKQGIHAIHKPVGFHPKLFLIQHKKQKDIDILFYGSLNDRRIKILQELKEKYNTKILFGVYGEQRDSLISRSKIVVQIYFYETKLFDGSRISYLLNNKVFSILEDTPYKQLEDSLVYAEYDKFVETCDYYLKNDRLRDEIAEKSFEAFSRYPESEFLERALSALM